MKPIITFRNLNKFYGSKHVLKDINLDIYSGQVIGYIGPNGAGKSTTVKILAGLLGDFSGEVTVDGIDIRTDPVAVKSKIGLVPELAELYDVLTPNEFLNLMGALYNMRPELVTERAGKMLEAFGLAGNLDQRMETFSKGMKQKVLITAGLMHNPEIIILDEPPERLGCQCGNCGEGTHQQTGQKRQDGVLLQPHDGYSGKSERPHHLD